MKNLWLYDKWNENAIVGDWWIWRWKKRIEKEAHKKGHAGLLSLNISMETSCCKCVCRCCAGMCSKSCVCSYSPQGICVFKCVPAIVFPYPKKKNHLTCNKKSENFTFSMKNRIFETMTSTCSFSGAFKTNFIHISFDKWFLIWRCMLARFLDGSDNNWDDKHDVLFR